MDVNTLYVQTQGSFGHEAIIFLHAYPMTSQMWKEQMSFFSKTHYILAPDLPGFGKGCLPDHAVSFEFYVEAILNFLKESGIKRSIWCGLSMGGYLALRLYEKAPELCSGLILANTKASADDNATLEKRWESIKELKLHREAYMEKQWQMMMSKKSQEDLKLKKRFYDIASKNSAEAMMTGLVALASRTDSRAKLKDIKVPTLIIAGEEDNIIPFHEVELLNEGIANSRLEFISGAGHLSNLENPESFNKVMASFLAEVHAEQIHRALLN